DADFVAARVELGRVLLEGGDAEAAIAECRAALEVLPTYAEAAELLATACRGAGRPREAVEVLVDLLTGDPYHLDGLVLLGQALRDDGRRADARQALGRALRFDPDRADALFHLGVVAADDRHFREAIEYWKRAVDADPEGPFAQPARDNIGTALDLAHVFHTSSAARAARSG
ncbi:MAG TPA: tetratricopeptide repeat protein, partial [Longimicrobiaceae bacterium]|nr:tetratricopeptide repeat protein [Longimicrobiaceae bacterium]